MRKILFAVLAAVASAATHKVKVGGFANEAVLLADANPATKYQLSLDYDFDFGYAVVTE